MKRRSLGGVGHVPPFTSHTLLRLVAFLSVYVGTYLSVFGCVPMCLLTFPRLFVFSWVFMVLAWSTCGFLPDFSALGCRHLLMGRIDLLGGLQSSGGLVVSPGGFLLSNGTKRGLEDFLVYGGSFLVLGANHLSFGRPCSPLSSGCPRGRCLPVLLPVGSRGVFGP